MFGRILIQAYQFEQWLPAEDQIVIHKNYTYESETKFLQQLAAVHGGIAGKYRMRKVPKGLGGHMAVLFDYPDRHDQEYLELFCLESPGIWEGESIRYILYVCVGWQFNWRKVKAVEQALRQMAASEENAALVGEKGREGLIQMVRMNF